MKVFSVSFFGHRRLEKPLAVEERLEKIIRELLTAKEYVEFLIGRNGEFDHLVASVVRRCKRNMRGDNSALVLVLPYETAEFRNNEESFQAYYDEIEVCAESSQTHFKAAHQCRNRYMVKRSDMVVFCVEHDYGGAFQTMRFAAQNGTPYINIC